MQPSLLHKKCYLCSATQNLIEYDDQDGICRKCYEQQTKQMLYFKSIRTDRFPQIDQIQQDIFLGNEDAATSEQILKQRGITAICVCGMHLDTPFIKNQKYVYKIYQIQDFPKQRIKQHFPDHFDWVNEMRTQKRKVLIHCAAGVSRSASFVIAYYMKLKNLPYHQAYKFVKEKRKWANPNSGFKMQLKQYNNELGLPAPTEQDAFL